MTIKGFIFDFDGLIIDTETPQYITWEKMFRSFGTELSLEEWSTCIGTSFEDFFELFELEKKIGKRVNREQLENEANQAALAMIEQQPILPGIKTCIVEGKNLGLKIGLASSSSKDWIYSHLNRLGLRDYFDAIFTRDDVQNTKPDPELYQRAMQTLNIKPYEGIVFEDSLNGLIAAKAAELYCVVIPNPSTKHLNLEKADLILDSLEDYPPQKLLSYFQDKERILS